jgi:phytoene desaturase
MPAADKRNTVVIIGAGVAGLTAGSYLARKGFHVKVLEANSKIGGCCGSTEINGYSFNDGAQYLIYPKLLDVVFSQLGFDRPDILRLKRVTTPGTTHLPNGTSVSIGNDFSITVENGEINIPIAQHELIQLVKKWAPVDEILTDEEIMLKPFSAWRLLSKAWKHLPKFGRTLKGEFEASFSDPTFRSAMAAQLLYAGAPLDKLPSVSIIALVSELKDGIALPEDGMGKIPEALAHILHQHGGKILLDARVKNIRLKNGRTCGVQTVEQGFVEGDFVISTANAMSTVQYLLDQSDQPKRLVQKAKRTPLSMSAFCVQLGVSNKLDVASHINHITPMMQDLDGYIQPAQDMAEWGYYSVPTLIASELAPIGGSIIEYVPVIRQNEPVEAWNDKRIDQLANASIEWLQSRHTMNITVKRIRSPRELQDQLNLYRGAIYGVSAAKGLIGLFPHKTPIEGLYLAGQTTYPGLGIPTAALSGIHASNALIQSIK